MTDLSSGIKAHVISGDRKSTRLNSSHSQISYAVFCLKKKKQHRSEKNRRRHPIPRPSRVTHVRVTHRVAHPDGRRRNTIIVGRQSMEPAPPTGLTPAR